MTRTIRLSCPDCSAKLQVVADDDTPHFTCPRCDKKMVVCVASRTKPKGASRPADRADDRALELDQGLSEEQLGVPIHQTPLQAGFHKLKSPKSHGYYRPRVHPWVGMRPYLLVAATASGLVSLFALVWFGSGVVRQVETTVHWPTFRQLADNHKSLFVDFVAENQRQLEAVLEDNADRAALLGHHLKEHQLAYEEILLRAIRLGEASRSSRAELANMLASAQSRLHNRIGVTEEDAEADYASQVHQLVDRLLSGEDQEHDSLLCQIALSGYLLSGIFELPAPRNVAEEVFVDEVHELRGLLKRLANIKYPEQLEKCAAEVETIAERLLDLAVRNSKRSNGFWERMPSEYWPIDQSFAIVQKALLRRIEREFGMNEKLKDALASVALARQSIVEASLGTTEATLRVRFADARAKRQKTIGLAMKLRMTHEDRDFIMQHWCCTNGSLQSLLSDSSEQEPPEMEVESYRPTNIVAANPATSIMASGPRTAGLLGSGTGGPKPNVAANEHPSPSRANATAAKKPEAHHDPVLRTEVDHFNGPYTVKIYIINNHRNLGSIVDRLAQRLFVRDSFSLSLDNKAIIGLRFAGELKEVSRVIDFGEVIEEDAKDRIIRVRGRQAD